MNRTKIAQLYADAESLGGQTVTVAGWVKSVRDMKNFGFVTLNDGSCFRDLQVVMNREALDNYDEIAHQNVSAALICTGTVKLTPDAPQPFELSATSIEVEGTSAPDYPLQKKRATVEFLRTQQHLRPRTNLFRAVFRIRSVAAAAIHRFFQEQGFVYVNTPIITTSDCEGAGEMFRVTTLDPKNPPLTESGEVDWSQDFFGKHASLTVSGQLNAENFAMAFGDVYTFGPTFRAENSNTTRHAAEFWMIEPEMAFAELEDIMELGEGLTRHVVDHALTRCESDLKLFDNFVDKGLIDRLKGMLAQPFARVSYREAIHILEDSGKEFTFPVAFGVDLQTEHERFLAEEHFRRPVIVYDYPKEIKAFYMRGNDDGETVAAMDVLVPRIGELIGGSQREERLDKLLARIAEMGQKPEDYWWYLDLRRFGSVPHAGFGMGFERLLMMLTGITNIRDVIPFPRTPGSLEF